MDTQPNASSRRFSRKREMSQRAMRRLEKAYVAGDPRPVIKAWNNVWAHFEDTLYWAALRYVYLLYAHVPALHQFFIDNLARKKDYFVAAFMEPNERVELAKIYKMASIEIICYFAEEYRPTTLWFLSQQAYLERVKHLPGIVLSVIIEPSLIIAYLECNGLDCVVINSQEFIDHVASLHAKTISDANSSE